MLKNSVAKIDNRIVVFTKMNGRLISMTGEMDISDFLFRKSVTTWNFPVHRYFCPGVRIHIIKIVIGIVRA
jgi:hypothetical protein